MKRPAARLLFALALVALLTPLASAGPNPPVTPENRNAAIRYWSATANITPTLHDKLAAVDWALVGDTTDPARFPQALKDAAEAVGHFSVGSLIAVTRMPKCDFELPMEEGINVLLPHLSKLRDLARILRVDARMQVAAGKPDEAAERIAAMIRMARHAANDDIMISSLVGIAIGTSALDEAAVFTTASANPAARAVVLDAIMSLPVADPMRMKEALKGEEHTFLDWARRTYSGPQGGKRLADECLPVVGENAEANKPSRAAISALDGPALQTAFDDAGRAYRGMLEAWDAPDVKARLDQIGADVAAGKYGPVASVFVPAASKAWSSDQKFKGRLAETAAKLRPTSQANPK